MGVRYNLDYGGFGAHVLRAPWMIAEMRARAERVAEAARAAAPVYEQGPHPGRYKDAFEVDSGVRVRETARAYGRVRNTAPEALAVEYGTRNNEAHHTLTTALDAAG